MDFSTLPPLPSFILEKIGGRELVHHAIKHGSSGPDKWSNMPTGQSEAMDVPVDHASQYWMSPALKKAIIAGDYNALKDARNKNQQDLQPNMTTIRNDTSKAAGFEQVTDEATGQDYFLCASDSGWYWSFTTSMDKTNAKGETKSICVVQSGSWTKDSSLLGISYQTFKDIPTDITALGAAGFAAYTVGNWIKNMILDMVFEKALSIAVAAAEEGVVEGGLMVSAAAASFAATVVAVVGAGVVGAILAIVIYYLSDFLHRAYGLTINVHNWDTQKSWTVASWYGDNATIAQETEASGPWKVATLLPVQNSLPGPLGTVTAKDPISQYSSYCFKNDNEWLEGLGVAMRVTTDSGAGFNLGYEVRRFKHNLIGVSSNLNQDLQTWYNDSSNWQTSGTTSYTGKIDGRDDLTVTIITSALDGDRGYDFDVHIGIQQSK